MQLCRQSYSHIDEHTDSGIHVCSDTLKHAFLQVLHSSLIRRWPKCDLPQRNCLVAVEDDSSLEVVVVNEPALLVEFLNHPVAEFLGRRHVLDLE